MTLNSVDLPAPLGPITARTSPTSTARSTASTATSPPNRRESERHSSSGTGRPLGARGRFTLRVFPYQAPDALGRQQHEGDEHGAEDERPELGDFRQLVLQDEKENSADDRADQGAGAAHDHH